MKYRHRSEGKSAKSLHVCLTWVMFQCLSVSLVVRKRRHKYSAFCLRRPRPLVNLILAPRIYVPGLQQL